LGAKLFANRIHITKIAGIGKDVFYRAIHSGELKAYKPNGRDFLLKVIEIEQWIESKPV